MAESESKPFLVLTAICDASARAAAVTREHGEAMERALNAAGNHQIDGLDLVELPISPPAFAALRKHLGESPDTVTVYDLFPLSARLDPRYRALAGQFLAAEALWTLEEQGLLQGVPFRVKFELPKGWDKDPKKLHSKLIEAGALDLDQSAITTFKQIRAAWEASVRR